MKLAPLLSNRVIYTLGFAAAGIWTALAFLRWNYFVDGPQFWSPTSNSYGLSLLFQSPLQYRAVASVIFFNCAAAAIGYSTIVRPIWGARQLAAPVWLLLAGAIPGYLLIIGVSRIVTLILPNRVAPWLVVAAVLGALAAIAWSELHEKERVRTSLNLATVPLAIVALLSMLVFEVQFDRFHVAGEAILFFIDGVFLSPQHGIGTSGHFPLFSQHYDEAAFLYPSVYAFMSPGGDARATLTTLYWITLAVGRLGAMSLTYVSFRGLGCDRLSALVAVAFIVASSLSLNPLSSHILFDSLSPLGYTLHVSRFLIPVLPLVIVSACAELWEGRLRKSASLPVAALLGAGLASVSLHVVLVLLWAVAVLALTVLFPKAAKASSLSRAGCAAAVLVLAGFTVGYSSIASASSAGRVVVLLASSALASVAALWPCLVVLRTGTFRVPDLTRGPAIQVASLCGAYAVGLLLLGNVLVHGAQGFLGALWPWPTVPVLDRFSTELVSPSQGLLQEPYCRQGFFWADRLLTGHCSSLSFFVRIYGLSIVLMTLVLAWKLLRDAKGQLAQDVRSTMMLWGMILSAVALPVAFVLFDFIGAVNPPADWNYGMGFLSTWLRSRLVEPWFYGGIALSLALFLRQATLRERRWAQSAMMICVALFALSPLMLPSQLVANMSYLLDAITW